MRQFTSITKLLSIVVTLSLPANGYSQASTTSEALQQKIQVMQQAAAENEQKLHQYQWIETVTVTMNGTPRPPKQSICRYNPYGTLEKTPLGSQGPPPASGGPLRQHIMEKKIEEAERELAATRELAARYLPLNPDVLKQAFQTRRVDLEREPAGGGDALILNDYVKAGDRLVLDLDTTGLQLRRITVKSYFSSPSEALTVTVQFSALADGTSYPSITTIDAPSKKLSINTVSSNFSRPTQ